MRAIARLAISVGCPAGIGPEVSVAAAAAPPKGGRVLLVGDLAVLRAAAKVRRIDPDRLTVVGDPDEAFAARDRAALFVYQPTAALGSEARIPGTPTRAGGAAQLAWVDAAMDMVAGGAADALVTGPVNKEIIASAGAPTFRGHTEHLARRLGAREVTMAFWTEKLTTSLVTTHLALSAVPRAVTAKEVARAIYWTARFVADLGAAGKPVAVAALNPHAGEGGLLGREERRRIEPGIARGRARLAGDRLAVAIAGPVPAESAFRLAASGAFSAVVAMYHDQATIPMKLLGFGEAVNVSLGLPIVRTSVDHGTAYDRAGKGTADPRGMVEAMKLGARLAVSGGADGRAGSRARRRR